MVVDHVSACELLHEIRSTVEDYAAEVLDLAATEQLRVAEGAAGAFDGNEGLDLTSLVHDFFIVDACVWALEAR